MAIDIQTPALLQAILPPSSYLRMQVSIDALTADNDSSAIDPCIRRGERIYSHNIGGS